MYVDIHRSIVILAHAFLMDAQHGRVEVVVLRLLSVKSPRLPSSVT